MNEREKVIKGLECCLSGNFVDACEECPYKIQCRETVGKAISPLREDAIELLTPIKPTVRVDTWICSKCGHSLESQELIDDKENPQVLIHEQYQYCPACGRMVKWDD